ncbi:hypothetical protein RFI_17814 [Reticulomyxa filosa]|uniref:Uncharacterized protein n=1 Tax=Reticulomyxa filosa TaxID=46433 RepID=X6N051_RETFI|nr:hypothetical protein RFI_17814 [Reticulomyxa filosa]|eukprot:ETO19416.1 hypothetical protein RFI_17814 [Reticulomyxa filosa]
MFCVDNSFVHSIFFDEPVESKKKKFQIFYLTSSRHHPVEFKEKNNKIEKMGNSVSKKIVSIKLPVKEDIKVIIQYWTRILNIKLGWIHELDKLVANYVITLFMFDTFRSSFKLLKTFTGHTDIIWSIDYSTFNGSQFICSGSADKTVRVWNVDANKQIQSFNGHLSYVYCVKFSHYYYRRYRNVICFSSFDKTIRFWDFKNNQQLQVFNEHTNYVAGIEFSTFNGGRYLCSGSGDNTIRLWDVEIAKSLHIFNGHTSTVWCVDISPFQSNNTDNNKSNTIGVIGGNGYTICSGSWDETIRIWDIEKAKQFIVFKGHKNGVWSVKYGSNELLNTILSGSEDKSVRLWDIRSGKQIQVFNGHTDQVFAVEYSPLVVKNIEVSGNSNVICSGSTDDTIRFWDIRSNKSQLYGIKENKKCNGITGLKFISLTNKNTNDVSLCYGSVKGPIRVWGKTSFCK